MHLVFWQKASSHHQSPVMLSLARMPGVTVTWVVDAVLQDWRRAMGWQAPDSGSATLIERPSNTTVEELARGPRASTFHIFSTDRGSSTIRKGLESVLRNSGNLGLMSETADLRMPWGIMRLLHGRMISRRLSRRVGFVLAIGQNGVRWFRLCGYSAQKIFRYGYFVPAKGDQGPDGLTESFGQDAFINLLYIGQLIRRKGVDVLIRAMTEQTGLNARLIIVGEGTQRQRLESLVPALGLERMVSFVGSLPNQQAMKLLMAADLLVLPSRWDGWGAVVNEALMHGVPVICSDKCGAKDLLDGQERGGVFRSGSVESLGAALGHWLAKGHRTPSDRLALEQWSRCISGEEAANYVIKIINHVYHGAPRPEPPWLRV